MKSELFAGARWLELPLHPSVDGFLEFGRRAYGKATPYVMYLEAKALPVFVFGALGVFLFHISFACSAPYIVSYTTVHSTPARVTFHCSPGYTPGFIPDSRLLCKALLGYGVASIPLRSHPSALHLLGAGLEG
jgi:hypothetical protein